LLGEGSPETRTEECEGIGEVTVKVYYPAEETLPLPLRPAPGPPMPGTEAGAVVSRWNSYAVQRMRGQVSRRNFSHLPDSKLTLLSFWDYFVVGMVNNIMVTIQYRLEHKR
jgi:hypothetical protein